MNVAKMRKSTLSCSRKLLTPILLAALLAGCVTSQQQPDGSTKMHLSLGNLLPPGLMQSQSSSASSASSTTAAARPATPAVTAPSIRTSALAGLFAKHPFDGTAKTYFPRVAVTVTDWSRNDCWNAVATIWWNKTKSEQVAPFSVCWGQSVGYAVNNAANLHLFMEQMAFEHSGNVRSTGPKPPMMAIPERQPIGERQQLAFQGFIEQLVLDTGWQPGAPTNMWLVGYDANAGAKSISAAPSSAQSPTTTAASTPSGSTGKPLSTVARKQLEQALSCVSISKFDAAESALSDAGWQLDHPETPVLLSQPIKIFGLTTHKVAVSRDSGEQTYRAYLPGVSVPQLVKAAALKFDKKSQLYGRLTKLGRTPGVLTAGTENGETTLTCSIDTEAGME